MNSTCNNEIQLDYEGIEVTVEYCWHDIAYDIDIETGDTILGDYTIVSIDHPVLDMAQIVNTREFLTDLDCAIWDDLKAQIAEKVRF